MSSFLVNSLRLTAALLVALVISGCEPRDSLPFSAEMDEPHYRRAVQLQRQGRHQEALSAYTKVVEKRAGEAPESHLECGLIYLQHMKDPIAAIYHLRKYLELRPNSPQSELVRQRIDTARREFAKTLPARPLEGQIDREEMLDRMRELQNENFLLKQQVAQLTGTPTPQTPGTVVFDTGTTDATQNRQSGPAVPGPAEFTPVETAPVAEAPQDAPPIAIVDTRSPQPSPTPTEQVQPPPQTPSSRTHSVEAGDTLMKISQRYYNTRSRWREIYAANKDTMRAENDLRIGQKLKIP